MRRNILFLIIISLLLTGCTRKQTSDLVSQVYETEDNPQLNRDERVQELTGDIKKLEKDLDEVLEKYQKVGNFQRALGIKMMHYKMFFKAYEHFSNALEYYPNSEMLLYYRGIAASQYALSQDVETIKRDYLQRALNSHERSLEINPGFVKGLYALSILYIYEFDRPEDAKPLLDRMLEISSREFDGMLLRALLYEKDGELNAALDLYDKVLSLSKNEQHIYRAETHRDEVLNRLTNE